MFLVWLIHIIIQLLCSSLSFDDYGMTIRPCKLTDVLASKCYTPSARLAKIQKFLSMCLAGFCMHDWVACPKLMQKRFRMARGKRVVWNWEGNRRGSPRIWAIQRITNKKYDGVLTEWKRRENWTLGTQFFIQFIQVNDLLTWPVDNATGRILYLQIVVVCSKCLSKLSIASLWGVIHAVHSHLVQRNTSPGLCSFTLSSYVFFWRRIFRVLYLFLLGLDQPLDAKFEIYWAWPKFTLNYFITAARKCDGCPSVLQHFWEAGFYKMVESRPMVLWVPLTRWVPLSLGFIGWSCYAQAGCSGGASQRCCLWGYSCPNICWLSFD